MRVQPREALPLSLQPRGLSRVEAAAYVGVSPTLFDIMVREGQMPRPARYRRRLLWDRRQIDRSLDAIFNEQEGYADAVPEFVL